MEEVTTMGLRGFLGFKSKHRGGNDRVPPGRPLPPNTAAPFTGFSHEPFRPASVRSSSTTGQAASDVPTGDSPFLHLPDEILGQIVVESGNRSKQILKSSCTRLRDVTDRYSPASGIVKQYIETGQPRRAGVPLEELLPKFQSLSLDRFGRRDIEIGRLAGLLASMVNLRSLDLSGTRLTSDEFRRLDLSRKPKLGALRLGGCSLTAAAMADSSLWELEGLRRLDLSYSVRHDVNSLPFERLRNLESLVLVGNQIINPNSLRLPRGLLELNMESCGHYLSSYDADLSRKAPNLRCLRLPFPIISPVVLPNSLKRIDVRLDSGSLVVDHALYPQSCRLDERFPKLEALNLVAERPIEPARAREIYFPDTLQVANLGAVFRETDGPYTYYHNPDFDPPTGVYSSWRRYSTRVPRDTHLIECLHSDKIQYYNVNESELTSMQFEEAVRARLPHLVPWMW